MKIIIVGGGIGGLAAALACAKSGHNIIVLERQNEFTEIGAGIQLAPNAFHAMDYLGVGDKVKALAVKIKALRLIDGLTGEQIAGLSLDEDYQKHFGNPYWVVHRTDLYYSLLDACRNIPLIELRTSSKVSGYSKNDTEVVIQLSDGNAIAADIAIGADGIRSVIRQQFVADGLPRVSGHTIYRSVIPMDKVPLSLRQETVNLWAGSKWHFVCYPIAGGEYLNLAITKDNGATLAVSGEDISADKVLLEFPLMHAQAQSLLNLGEGWKKWVLCDRDPIDNWTENRVALLGDAAHPMLQYAAQGACMALEDAVVLGNVLTDATKNEAATCLKKYNKLRRDRTAKVIHTARKIGDEIYHASGKEAEARNLFLKSLTQKEAHSKIAWLHGMSYPFFSEK